MKLTPERQALALRAREMKERGMTFTAIGRELHIPTTTIQRWLKDYQKHRSDPYEMGENDVSDLPLDDVGEEIRMFRVYVKKAVEAGEPAILIAQLLRALNELVKTYSTLAIRSGKMLHVDTCKQFVNVIGAAFVDEFRDVCPDAMDRIDRVITSISDPVNTRQGVQELLHNV